MIQVRSYAKRKKDSNSNSVTSSGTGYAGSNNNANVNGVYIFGNYHDHTADISGDLSNVDNILMNGNITGANTINSSNIISTNGAINTLHSDTITVDSSIFADDIVSENIYNSNEITTKNLTVTGAAYFFQLIIDKIKAVGGAVLLTPADGFVVDRVAPVPGSATELRLMWKATDGERKIANMWQVNDQAICQTFNAAEGVNYNVSNKYYWCLVTGVGTITQGDQDYHYINISTTTADGTVNPEPGDEIAMLGYRGNDDSDRQSAIYIAAYNSIDPDISAPLIAQYEGINDFDLSSHRTSVLSSGYNEFHGTFLTVAGDDVATQLTTILQTINSISATVKTLTYDTNNLFGVSSFAGSEFEEGSENRWEFRSTANYSFDLWDLYNCVFERGLNEGRWIMLANGTSTIYTPYLNLQAGQTYTLNMDFIKYDGDNAIKLYNYANENAALTLTSSQEWYINSNGQLVTTRPASRDYFLNDDVIQFSVPSNGIYRIGFQNIIYNYNINDDNFCDLNYVRLYKGAFTPEQFLNWNDQLSESYSRLYMNSGKIELSVNEISLILDGIRNNIVLNGNTIINGTLNLNDATQGLVLTGNNGVTKFSPESIGTYSQWSAKTLTTRNVDQFEDLTPTVSTGNNYQSVSVFEYVFGNQKLGNAILISNLLLSVTGNTATNYSTTLQVYENDILKTTYTFTGTTLPETYEWDMTANAILKFKFTVTVTYTTSNKGSVNLAYEITAPITALLQIGYDGIGINYENNSTVYFGPAETVIAYDNYAIKVTDTGIYRWQPDYGWCIDQKEQVVKTITSNYTLGYNDDFIIGNGNSSITLTLPTTFPSGKKIYVKNLTGNTFTVSSSNVIILQDHTTPTSSFTTGNRTYFLIWSGTYWIVGYCG